MNPGLVFLIGWLASCAGIAGIIATAFNYDRVGVAVLRAVNAPVFPEARGVAALVYQHPDQWKVDSYGMEHPRIGRMRLGHTSIEVSGQFGSWEPNAIERRIIWDAVRWYRSVYIKALLVKALNA